MSLDRRAIWKAATVRHEADGAALCVFLGEGQRNVVALVVFQFASSVQL